MVKKFAFSDENEFRDLGISDEVYAKIIIDADESAIRFLGSSLVFGYGIDPRDFEKFLSVHKFSELDIFEGVIELWQEGGIEGGNLRNYLEWIKNGIEDINRFDGGAIEFPVKDLIDESEGRSALFWIIVIVIVNSILLLIF